jgi:hypothetical protein
VLKLSDLGSNLTRVLGFTPDSLYQTTPSFVIAIPYGSESDFRCTSQLLESLSHPSDSGLAELLIQKVDQSATELL